jgi:AcrR family transcriptional regulator
MNKSESKYFNTAVRMDEALISLLARKEFAFITVREICEAAGVNRSTFYLHYESTNDLLEEAVRYTEERFFDCFPRDRQSLKQRLLTCPLEELILVTPEYLEPYLSFIRDNRLVYRTAVAKPELWHSERQYNAMFRDVFDPILERFHYPPNMRKQVVAFYIGGISAVVSAWLKDGCRQSIGEIIQIIRTCIVPREQGFGNTNG